MNLCPYCIPGIDNCTHMKDLPIHETIPVEAAASIGLNKGTPPDYARPAFDPDPTISCYLCGGPFPEKLKVNWRGHWICPGCYQKGTGWLQERGQEQEGREKELTDWILHPKVYKLPDTSGPVSASDILEQAASTIEQRGKDYNSPGGERSMRATVEAFNAIRGKDLSVVDGWAFMEILKMVRAKHSPHKIDNFLDGAAYAALAGEEALNSQK